MTGGTSLSTLPNYRVNERIRIREVRLIDEQGEQVGVIATATALAMARERGLDLVEVAPTATPPVCRLLDYGQFKYEQSRKAREMRKHQQHAEIKEVRLTTKIGDGDLQTKIKRIIHFLEDGHKVKVSIRFRGREITHAELGRRLLDEIAAAAGEHGDVERQPLLEGRFLWIQIAPKKTS